MGRKKIKVISPEDAIKYTRKRIGIELRITREASGLSLRDFSDKCGVGYSHIARIERGQSGCNIDTIAVLANALGMKLTLVDINPVMANPKKEAQTAHHISSCSVPEVQTDNHEKETSENMDTDNEASVSCS